eukprot:TRINITY_DN9920_c0_g1_i2.p1 TRINITY_DN9920_c0_g1~~TRINITY_DN9920_c0_g1_i2.p1  ORF type:complete len:612 (-),score=135.49 TRINITY_DN9920_c0_g1_i2:565-2400(-)
MKESRLEHHQIEQLERIRTMQMTWSERCKQLQDWIEAHNGILPQKHSKDKEERQLKYWLWKQRAAMKKGCLEQHQIEQLERIPTMQVTWSERCKQLQDWIEAHNGILPQKHSKDKEERRLIYWFWNQSAAMKKGCLEQHQIEQLERIPTMQVNRSERCKQLQDWIEAHNGILPQKHSKDKEERRLKYWLWKQRAAMKKGCLEQHQIEQLERIPTMQVTWSERCKQLQDWIEAHNGILPQKHSKDEEERRLIYWLWKQRAAMKKGYLEQHQIEQLEQFQDWVQEHNDSLPQQRSEDKEDRRLTYWFVRQRAAMKQGRLDQYQVEQLQSSLHHLQDEQREQAPIVPATWSERCKQLLDWIETHKGSLPQNVSEDKEERGLANWLWRQRTAMNRRELSQYQAQQLEQLPYTQATWNERYKQIKDWVEAHKGALPQHVSEDKEERRLANWFARQRAAMKQEDLSQYQAQLLGQLPLPNPTWGDRCKQVQEWVKEHKGALPQHVSRTKEERQLADWLKKQRAAMKNGELTKGQAQQLDQFPGLHAKWTESCKQLKEWVEAHNDALPQQCSKDKEERRLAYWLSRQRTATNKGKLEEWRCEQLERITIGKERKHSQA